MPKIREMLSKLEGFQCATSLVLNMGHYHIRLSDQASNLCTIILPWGKYIYKLLPMGICNSPEICGFEFIRAYIDELFITTKGNCSNQLNKLERFLQNLKDDGLRCNI